MHLHEISLREFNGILKWSSFQVLKVKRMAFSLALKLSEQNPELFEDISNHFWDKGRCELVLQRKQHHHLFDMWSSVMEPGKEEEERGSLSSRRISGRGNAGRSSARRENGVGSSSSVTTSSASLRPQVAHQLHMYSESAESDSDL